MKDVGEEASGVEGVFVGASKNQTKSVPHAGQTPHGAGTWLFSRTLELKGAFAISSLIFKSHAGLDLLRI